MKRKAIKSEKIKFTDGVLFDSHMTTRNTETEKNVVKHLQTGFGQRILN